MQQSPTKGSSRKQHLRCMAHFSWGSGSGSETELKPRIMLHLFPWLYFSFRLKRKRKKTQNCFKSHRPNVVRAAEYNPTGSGSGNRALSFKWVGFTFDGALKVVKSSTLMDYFVLIFYYKFKLRVKCSRSNQAAWSHNVKIRISISRNKAFWQFLSIRYHIGYKDILHIILFNS